MTSFVILWCIVLVVLLAIEAATLNLVTIWLAVGAVAALLSCAFNLSFFYQFVVFVLVSALALLASKPLVDKARNRKPRTDLGLNRNIGKTATVVAEITPQKAGRVRLDGVDWIAQSDASIAKDTLVTVMAVDATTLVVAAQ